MRAFIALDLPEEVLEPITRLQAGLPVGRKVAEENMHLTLAFLGEVSEARLGDLAGALAGVRLPAFDLTLKGLDMFGGKKPHVLFVAALAPELERLHDKVANAVRAAGIKLPRDRFHPHVTLARFPRDMSPKDQQSLGEFLALNGTFALPPARVTRFTLYGSQLRPEGPVHEALAEFELAG